MLKAEYLMKQRGLTQTELARMCGIDRTNVNHIFRGYIRPYPKYVNAIAQALGWDRDPWELFTPIIVEI